MRLSIAQAVFPLPDGHTPKNAKCSRSVVVKCAVEVEYHEWIASRGQTDLACSISWSQREAVRCFLDVF